MRVFQMVATNECHPHFDRSLIDELYHAYLGYAGPRTVCGIQLDGDDGVAPGPDEEGFVTCPQCACIIEEIQRMENWRKT